MYQFEVVGIESEESFRVFRIKSFEQAYRDVHSSHDIRDYCVRNFTKKTTTEILKNPKCICTFAIKSGAVAGLSVIEKRSCPVMPELMATELKQLYLLSSEYGTGLGRKLIEDAIDKAKESGSHHLWLCVSNLNFRAFRFYQKFGFTKIGDGPVLEVGIDRLPSSIMIKEL